MKRKTIERETALIKKRLKQRRADSRQWRADKEEPESWITVKGKHIPLDENGVALGGAGGWAKGKSFSKAKSVKSSKSTAPRKAAARIVSPGVVLTGKDGKLSPKSAASKRIDTSDAMDEIKSGRHNSLEEHMDAHGNLTPERQRVHDEIIQKFFADKIAYKGKPSLIMSGGGPASGKTFVRKKAESDFGEETTVTIDPDKLKEMLPGYEEMATKDEGAAGFYHEESSSLAKRAYQFAVDNGINVVYDGTGDGSTKSVGSKIATAQSAGYAVKASYVTVPTEEALRRNQKRYEDAKAEYDAGKSKIPPRLPREDLVKEIHRKVSDISIQVAKDFDEFDLFDNNVPRGYEPIKIATCKKSGEITAVKGREKKLQEFLDKGAIGAKVVNGKVVFKTGK